MSTTVSFRLRAARPADRAFLFRLYAAGRAEEVAATGWSRDEQQRFLRSQFEARQLDYGRNFSAAKDHIILIKREPAGRVLVQRSPGAIRLIDIAILPGWRGHGVGRSVLRGLMTEACRERAVLSLSVREDNFAIQLYLREGFVPTGYREGYKFLEYNGGLNVDRP